MLEKSQPLSISSPTDASSEPPVIHTDVLIVGMGPAGAFLAYALGFNGVKGMIISKASSTSVQPRAHMTNPAAWECFRDLGLEPEFRKASVSKDYYGEVRFCESLTGADIARTTGFANVPARKGEYELASPCAHGEISQSVGESLLVKYLSQHGFAHRFDTTFLSHTQDPKKGLVTSVLKDEITGQVIHVVSKYLCGADGASSSVAKQAELPFQKGTATGSATDIWFEADLSHIYNNDPGLLNTVVQPYAEVEPWAMCGYARVVRPYTEWIMSALAVPGATPPNIPSQEEALAQVYRWIGDENVDVKIKGVSRWRINERYATQLSSGNVFCLGDAVHQHPPAHGLGSNTCIQDAYNLAWKLAYVLQGKAGPELLDSYSLERQPVGQRVVKIANDTVRTYERLMHTLGMTVQTLPERLALLDELRQATPEGIERRGQLKQVLEDLEDEHGGLGGEMNLLYKSSAVVLAEDETGSAPTFEGRSGVRHHIVSTYPGSRLPHAWLGTKKHGEKISTQDIAGKGRFVLLTGIGGKEVWESAAKQAVQAAHRVDIHVYSIGRGQDLEDPLYMWEDRRGVTETGAVLVRPDRIVAWRCHEMVPNCGQILSKWLKRILSLEVGN